MKSPLIHILGAGRWQVPTILRAKELGYRVLVTDMFEDPPGYSIADYHEQVDIVNIEKTMEVAKRYYINGIICDTTDVGVPTMAYIAERLNLRGLTYQTALRATNKYIQRKAFYRVGLRQPDFLLATSMADIVNFSQRSAWPVVVKPVDSQSARGVSIVAGPDDVKTSYELAMQASASGQVIVESHLSGKEISVEGIVVNRRVEIIAIADKDHFPGMPTIASQILYPAAISCELRLKIKESLEMAICCLAVETGVFHAEYMIVEEEPYIVEIASRGGGSRIYTDIVPALYNHDVVSSYLKYLIEGVWEKGSIINDAPPQAANLIFFKFPYGVIPHKICGIQQARSITGVKEIEIELELDKPVKKIDSGRSRHGYALIYGDSREAVMRIGNQIRKTIYLISGCGNEVFGDYYFEQ